MKKTVLLALLGLVGALQAGSLQVLQKFPLGETESLKSGREIVATFSQPMVALSGNEDMGSFCPIRLTPSLPGRCRWRGTNTLVYELQQAPKAGTEYSVVIPKGIASKVSGDKLAQEVSWSFTTPRPKLESSAPAHDERWVDLKAKLFVGYDQPMDAAQAASHLLLEEAEPGESDPDPQPDEAATPQGVAAKLKQKLAKVIGEGPDAGRTVPIEVKLLDQPTWKQLHDENALKGNFSYGYQPDCFFMLTPKRPLKPGKRYRIWALQGLPGKDGGVGTKRTQVIAFETWGDFKLHDVAVARDCGYPAGKRYKLTMLASPTWRFSNPVDAASFFEHLTITPLPPKPADQADATAQETGEEGGEEGGDYDDNGGYHAGGGTSAGPLINGQALRLEDEAGGDNNSGPQRRVYRRVSLGNLRLSVGQTYTFALKPGVKDAYGNKLSEGGSWKLSVPDYCPDLSVPTGYSVMESYLKPRHPADGLNIKEWPVKLWGFKPADYVPALESLSGHDRGYGGECGVPFPGQPSVETKWSMDAPVNVRSKSYIDLMPSLKGRPGGLAGFEIPPVQGDCPYRGLDNITDLGLSFKTAPDSTLLWVTRLKDGKPAADVAVELRLADNRSAWTGRTDKSGLAHAPGWRALGIKSWDGSNENPRLYAIAYSVNGDAVMGNESAGIEPWRFGIDYAWKPEERHHRGLVFTDRGLYKPGEEVKIKAVLRSLGADDWTYPASKDLKLSLSNSRGEQVLAKDITLGERGSFSLTFPLPEDAPTGPYDLQLYQPRRKLRLGTSFRVEAFKPAAFEVRVKNQRPEAFAGEPVGADIEGWYLYGAPMNGAQADYNVLFSAADFSPAGWDEFGFGRPWWEERYYNQVSAANGGLTLTAKGRAAIEVQTKGTDFKGPFSVRYEVGVTSPDRQRLMGRSTHLVHPSHYYVGCKLDARVMEKGQSAPLSVIVTDTKGQAVPGVTVKGQWHRLERMSVRRVGLHGRLSWEHSQKDVPLPDFELKSGVKPVDWSFKPDKAGEYYLSLAVKDPQGLSNGCSTMVYVAGPGQSWWSQEDHDLIKLVADKRSYKPGDTAKILVQSPWDGAQALVTVERETVLDSWTLDLKSASSLIEVPIKDAYLPNAYISVTLVRGRLDKQDYDEAGLDLSKPQARFGYINLPVEPEGRRLTVKAVLDKQDYRPGGQVHVDLAVTDATGGAAPTELTIWAVDEGVLQLTGYRTPDLFDAFYGPRPLYVGTSDARLHVLGQRSYGEKGQDRGGGGGAPGLDAVDVRGDFRFLAHWTGNVLTGADGKAKVDFKLPDNLSAFRLMVAAHTEKRFGKTETRFTVSKPLMLRPSLPRFARLGDKFQGGVVLHNNSSKDAEVDVKAVVASGPLGLGGKAVQHVKIGAGKAQELLWPLSATALGPGVLEFRASGTLDGPETDGLRWKIPVTVPEKRESVATAGVVSDEEVKEALKLPSNGLAEKGDVTVSFASTALGGLKDGVSYLLDYPYGCLEQQLSRSLPVVVGAEVLEGFGLADLAGQKAAAQQVLNKLPSYQCSDGGYTYWGVCEREGGSPYLTAYALEVAWLAQRAGYKVPEQSLARAVSWLKGVFDERQNFAYPYGQSTLFVMRAYALDALSLYGEAPNGYMDQLYGRRDQLPFLAKAHLLKAAKQLKADGKAVDTLAQELLNQAKVAPRSLHFELPEGERWDWLHASSVQATAVCLEALITAHDGFAGDEKAVQWLAGERKDKGAWRSTQENAWGLRAFDAFYRKYEAQPPSFKGVLDLTGPGAKRQLWSQDFVGRSLSTLFKALSFEDVFGDKDEADLRFTKQGTGRLYYSLLMKYTPKRFDKPAFEGFEIRRTVTDLETGADVGDKLQAGRRYKVTLNVDSRQDRSFVALVDPLPGGVEAVNTAFATEDSLQAEKAGVTGGDYYGFMHHELYDDRVQIFANYLREGAHEWSYLIQATNPGSFARPSAWIEQMYEPEVFGRTASGQTEVAPQP